MLQVMCHLHCPSLAGANSPFTDLPSGSSNMFFQLPSWQYIFLCICAAPCLQV